MKKHLFGSAFGLAAAALLAFGAAGAAQAEELASSQPSHIYGGVGYFDIGDTEANSAAFEIGYIPDYNILFDIRPLVGAFVNTDGGLYGHVGLSRSIFFTDNILARLQVGFGAYSEGGSKDLGQVFEFREQVELGYQFDSGDMVSVYFYHMSNAGMSSTNPGVNSLGVYYSLAY